MTWTAAPNRKWKPRAAVMVWGRTGRLLWRGPLARSVAVSPTANRIAVLTENRVRITWPGEEETTVLVDRGTYVVFSPDGRKLAVGGESSSLLIIDVDSGQVLLERRLDVWDPFQEYMHATCMRWSPNGKWLGMTLGDGVLPVIIDPADGRTQWSGGFCGGGSNQVTWTPYNRLICAIGETYLVEPDSGKKSQVVEYELYDPAFVGNEALVLGFETIERFDLGTLRRQWVR